MRMNWFFHGNITSQEAIHIVEKINDLLIYNSSEESSFLKERIVKLPKRIRYVYEKFCENNETNNSAFLLYFQGGFYEFNDLKRFSTNYILLSLLNVEAYYVLRTKKQLGYVLSVNNVSFNKVYGGTLLIQSPNYAPIELALIIEEFVEGFFSYLSSYDQKKFEDCVNAKIETNNQKYLGPYEEFNEFKNFIESRDYAFNFREKIVESLKNIIIQDVINYAKEMLIDNPSRFEYSIISHKHLEKNKEAKDKYEVMCKSKGFKIINIHSEIEMKNLNKMFQLNTP